MQTSWSVIWIVVDDGRGTAASCAAFTSRLHLAQDLIREGEPSSVHRTIPWESGEREYVACSSSRIRSAYSSRLQHRKIHIGTLANDRKRRRKGRVTGMCARLYDSIAELARRTANRSFLLLAPWRRDAFLLDLRYLKHPLWHRPPIVKRFRSIFKWPPNQRITLFLSLSLFWSVSHSLPFHILAPASETNKQRSPAFSAVVLSICRSRQIERAPDTSDAQ